VPLPDLDLLPHLPPLPVAAAQPSVESLEHPVSGPTTEREALVAHAVVDSERRLVVIRSRPIEDLDEHHLLGLDARALALPRVAGGGLERAALPAAILRVRRCELRVDAPQVLLELALSPRELPLAGDDSAEHEDGEHDQDDQEPGGHPTDYSSTARACRWAPTFRFTRWSALSTVLASQPRRSPMSV